MRIASTALTQLSKVFRQARPSQGDLELTIPAVVSPTVTLRAPLVIASQFNQNWNESNIVELSLTATTTVQATNIANLEVGLWELTLQVAHKTFVVPASEPFPAFTAAFEKEDASDNVPFLSLHSPAEGVGQQGFWQGVVSLRERTGIRISLAAMGASGEQRAFLSLKADRLLD